MTRNYHQSSEAYNRVIGAFIMIFKCKMCGGSISITPGSSVGVCDYCKTKQTMPLIDDEKRANLYDRANHYRRNNEFDKAIGLYEQILNEDKTDSEAYWSLVLCRYGIEYVEDFSTHKRIPTINRSQFTSIFDDENYKSALKYATKDQCELYEKEASYINDIQKGILDISRNEKPFDVFVCYKETDNNGRRTPDSVLANEIYYQLMQLGLRVFYSRITLEDKIGSAYEPYIFAALNSAKIMIAIGTKPEYYQSPWVKNEWGRFLALVKISGGKKTLIPAYKDMDPYDLPEEFSHLQALDMSKLGFIQDLIRGINKIMNAEDWIDSKMEINETVNTNSIVPLLKRAFIFLEDGEYEKAYNYCERVLDQDPENEEGYLGELMVDMQVQRKELLAECDKPFDSNKNYQKILRYGSESLCTELKKYIDQINKRNKKTAENKKEKPSHNNSNPSNRDLDDIIKVLQKYRYN